MKYLFIWAMLVASIKCLGQAKRLDAAKVVEPPYFKFSPSLLFIKDADPLPAIFGGFGGRFSRYAAIGFAGGYFKLQGATKGIIPLGLDFTFCDFKAKKVLPVFTAQTYIPIYESYNKYSSGGAGSYSIVTASTKGRFMFNIGAGLAISITKSRKFFLTGSYGQLLLKSSTKSQYVSSGGSSSSSKTTNSEIEMGSFSMSLML
jgi:hypothetical protein